LAGQEVTVDRSYEYRLEGDAVHIRYPDGRPEWCVDPAPDRIRMCLFWEPLMNQPGQQFIIVADDGALWYYDVDSRELLLKGEPEAPRRPPLRPELPVNRAKRSGGSSLADNVHQCIDLTRRTRREAALTAVESHFLNTYTIDSFVTNSGFNGYFEQYDNPDDWPDVVAALNAVGLTEAAQIMAEAMVANRARGDVADDADQPTINAWRNVLRDYDQRWFDLGLDLDRILSNYVEQNYPWA
jgi:hypothetical protein